MKKKKETVLLGTTTREIVTQKKIEDAWEEEIPCSCFESIQMRCAWGTVFHLEQQLHCKWNAKRIYYIFMLITYLK